MFTNNKRLIHQKFTTTVILLHVFVGYTSFVNCYIYKPVWKYYTYVFFFEKYIITICIYLYKVYFYRIFWHIKNVIENNFSVFFVRCEERGGGFSMYIYNCTPLRKIATTLDVTLCIMYTHELRYRRVRSVAYSFV